MRAFVVANDLVVYATAIAQPTGIQRVGKGALEGLLNVANESGGAISIEPITISNGKARLVSPSSLGIGGSTRRSAWFAQPLLHLLAHAPKWLQESVRAVARRLLARGVSGGGLEASVGAGDWVLVLGAPWIAPGTAAATIALCSARRARIALLVHDLLPLTNPEWYASRQGREARADVQSLIVAADMLFAVSPEVAHEISATLNRTAFSLVPAEEMPVARGVRDDYEPFILFVGTLHPRKRVDALVRALIEIAKTDGVDKTPRLVIAGRRHPDDHDLFSALTEAKRIQGLRERIVLIHDADDTKLATLYASCRFTVLPSLAEGWGLPVRESLAAGRPAIATEAVPAAVGSPFVRVIPVDDQPALVAALREWWLGDLPEQLAVRILNEFRARSWRDVALELVGALRAA